MRDPIWLTVLFCLLVATVFTFAHGLQRHFARKRFYTYRSRYLQMIAQLDVIAVMAAQLNSFASKISQRRILDLYEQHLSSLEAVLHAFKDIPPCGQDLDKQKNAQKLVKDCYEKFSFLQWSFRDDLGGRKIPAEKLRPMNITEVVNGCYFCSRPGMIHWLEKVKIKIDGSTKDVLSCRICAEELRHSKKVKVLYFVKEGKPIHWSEISDYKPSEDFWNVNKRKTLKKTKHLELVYSHPSTLSSKDLN